MMAGEPCVPVRTGRSSHCVLSITLDPQRLDSAVAYLDKPVSGKGSLAIGSIMPVRAAIDRVACARRAPSRHPRE